MFSVCQSRSLSLLCQHPNNHGISVNFILSISAAARIILCRRASSNPLQWTRLQQCPNGRGILHLESRLVAILQSVLLSIPGRWGHAHVQSIPDPGISLHLLILRIIVISVILTDEESHHWLWCLVFFWRSRAHERIRSWCSSWILLFLLPLALQDLRWWLELVLISMMRYTLIKCLWGAK